MKKLTLFVVLICFILVISLFSFHATILADEITLTVSTNAPSADAGIEGKAASIFRDLVEKHTDGQISLEFFWAQSYLRGEEALSAARAGTVDIAFLNPNYYPEEMIAHQSLTLFPASAPVSFEAYANALFEIAEEIPAIDKEISDNNQKPLVRFMGSPFALASSEPVASLDDFARLNIRASGRYFLRNLDDLGANPVSVDWGDVYMALQTGTIDAVLTNLEAIYNFDQHEPAPNIFTMRNITQGVPFYYTINKDVYDGLSEEMQNALAKVEEDFVQEFKDFFDESWYDVVDYYESDDNYTIHHITVEEVERWTELDSVQTNMEEWMEEAERLGVENPAELLDKMEEIFIKWNPDLE